MTREEICQRLGWMTLPKTSEMLGKTQHSDMLDRIEKIVEAAVLAEQQENCPICECDYRQKNLAAAVLAEREACAKAAEGYADFQLQLGDDLAQWRAIGALAVMAAISERGQE